MKKVILKEIYRVQELMGVKKNLISEGRIMTRFANLLRDVLDGNSTQAPRAVARMGNRNGYQFNLPNGRTVGLLDTDVTDILSALRNNTGLRNLSDASKAAIREILQSLGHLNPENLWNDYVDEIIQMGGDEQNFFRGLERTMKQTNPNNPRVTYSLRDALNQRFPDDPDFVNEIFPYIDSKYADFGDGLLKLRNGRLVREISPAIDDFNRNILPLNNQEIQALRKSSFIQNVLLTWRDKVEIQNEIKRLFKTLDRENLEPEDRNKVEDSILENMNRIYNWRSDVEKHFNGFIKQLGESKDKSLIELKEKLESLKPGQGWQVARKITSEMSGARKEWEAFKEAFINATSLERAIGRKISGIKVINNSAKQVKKSVSDAAQETVEKAVPIRQKTLKNLINSGSRRGYPKESALVDSKGNLLPDFYKKLRDVGKNPLLWRSWGYEWFLRTIKYKIYYAFLETLVPATLLKIGISKKDNECCLALTEMMREKGISTTDEVVELISDNQLKIFPPCLVELIQKNETTRLGKIVGLADYYVSPLSGEKMLYFLPQMLESFLTISSLSDITTIIPGFYDDIAFDFIPSFINYMKLYDITGANIERDSVADSTNNPPPNPQDISTSGQTNTNSTTDVNSGETKNLLFNHLKTIPNLNQGGDKGVIAEPDLPYIFYMGNNMWEFELDDGIKTRIKFEYNPSNKTFTQKN